MLNLYQLSTFVTVVSEGSMTAAADKLYLTQPAVSQQIRNLEEELTVELLVRGVRQVKATPQGEILFEYAKKIIQLSNQAEVAIKSIGSELKGTLKLGTLNSIGLHIMSPIVGRLLRHNPDFRVRLDYHPGKELIDSFNRGLYDVAIMPKVEDEFHEPTPDCESKLLSREEMWFVGNGKDLNLPKETSLAQVCELPFVRMVEEYPGFEEQFNRGLGVKVRDLKIVFESSNVGTIKRVIESGLGCGFLPAHAIKKQVRSGRLNRIYVTDFDYKLDLMFYYKKNVTSTNLAETLFNLIAHQEKL